MKTAFLFPGQGAQTVGMGKDFFDSFPQAADIFKSADKILGYDLTRLCFEGPEEKLSATNFSQPAIFVTSAAILQVFRTNPATENIHPDVTAGLSLGEYTALYAAGVINFEDALILVQKRGDAMQAAAENSSGSMVSILGLDELKVTQFCKEAADGELLVPVNFNCPSQIVISGAKSACERAMQLAEKYGTIKAIPLKVAGAFHTEFMALAADELNKSLAKCKISDPLTIKIIANIDAGYYNNAYHISQGLVKQLVQPILWQKCIEALITDGIERFFEIGPGRVLTGLMKKINRNTNILNISTTQSIGKVS